MLSVNLLELNYDIMPSEWYDHAEGVGGRWINGVPNYVKRMIGFIPDGPMNHRTDREGYCECHPYAGVNLIYRGDYPEYIFPREKVKPYAWL